MLRGVEIPARVVTGFKGGSVNAINGVFEVEQRHAHAWVEAYVGDPAWITLDATPASRDASVESFASRMGTAHELALVVTSTWSRLVNIDIEAQQTAFFSPVMSPCALGGIRRREAGRCSPKSCKASSNSPGSHAMVHAHRPRRRDCPWRHDRLFRLAVSHARPNLEATATPRSAASRREGDPRCILRAVRGDLRNSDSCDRPIKLSANSQSASARGSRASSRAPTDLPSSRRGWSNCSTVSASAKRTSRRATSKRSTRSVELGTNRAGPERG